MFKIIVTWNHGFKLKWDN